MACGKRLRLALAGENWRAEKFKKWTKTSVAHAASSRFSNTYSIVVAFHFRSVSSASASVPICDSSNASQRLSQLRRVAHVRTDCLASAKPFASEPKGRSSLKARVLPAQLLTTIPQLG